MPLFINLKVYINMIDFIISCPHAEFKVCPDLTGSNITHEFVGTRQLRKICGEDVLACMELNLSTNHCKVTLPIGRASVWQRYVVHEENHCRGWNHGGGHRSHDREWTPFEEVRKLLK